MKKSPHDQFIFYFYFYFFFFSMKVYAVNIARIHKIAG